jgi:hypothetical protein
MNNPEKKASCGKSSMIISYLAIAFTLLCTMIAFYSIREYLNYEDIYYIVAAVGSFVLLALPVAGIILGRRNKTWINITSLIVSSFVLAFTFIMFFVMLILNA